MNWNELDWAALERLRGGFLAGPAAGEPYWKTESDLASYDFTYGERIGWKWEHVFRELRMRGWERPAIPGGQRLDVLDWGCGSGIAGRRTISFLGADKVGTLHVWDHSPLAANFAAAAAQKEFPDLDVSQVTPGFLNSDTPLGLLVISHVLNELSPDARASLQNLMTRAAAVIWVEPGTHEVSRDLGAWRDRLSETFRVVAPCTRQAACPILTAENERHWCHFFAPSAPGIFAHPEWVRFGQRAGIDLRSLPYAFIALERQTAASTGAASDPGLSRVIGRPEFFKPYARFLNCDATGLTELTVPKRTNPSLYKELERNRAPLVYRWHREGDQITSGEPPKWSPI